MEAHAVGTPAPEPARSEVVDTYVDRGPAAYIAEFIGTFALVFFITAVVSLYITPATPNSPVQPFIDWSVIGLVHAFALFMLIQTLAVISGAHLNPAVTVALATVRQIRPSQAVIYVVLQLAGGILGALLTKAILKDEGAGVNYGAPAVTARLSGSTFLGALCEGIGTFFLVWSIIGVAVSPHGLRDWSGFAIGATYGFLVMIFGPLTGGALNPARAFGPALVGHAFDGAGKWIVVYVVGPVIGAALSAFLYTYVFTTPGKKGVVGMDPVG